MTVQSGALRGLKSLERGGGKTERSVRAAIELRHTASRAEPSSRVDRVLRDEFFGEAGPDGSQVQLAGRQRKSITITARLQPTRRLIYLGSQSTVE